MKNNFMNNITTRLYINDCIDIYNATYSIRDIIYISISYKHDYWSYSLKKDKQYLFLRLTSSLRRGSYVSIKILNSGLTSENQNPIFDPDKIWIIKKTSFFKERKIILLKLYIKIGERLSHALSHDGLGFLNLSCTTNINSPFMSSWTKHNPLHKLIMQERQELWCLQTINEHLRIIKAMNLIRGRDKRFWIKPWEKFYHRSVYFSADERSRSARRELEMSLRQTSHART